MTNAGRPAALRIGRVTAELKMRRRRLDAYRRAPDWPGKEPSWRWELSRYDEFLLLAASMLDVAVPQHDKVPLAPEVRALVEDRLSQAGLDVWAPRVIRESRRRHPGAPGFPPAGWPSGPDRPALSTPRPAPIAERTGHARHRRAVPNRLSRLVTRAAVPS